MQCKYICRPTMVIVAQLVRAPDCGSGGRGFEPRLSPFKSISLRDAFFFTYTVLLDLSAVYFVINLWQLIIHSMLKERLSW